MEAEGLVGDHSDAAELAVSLLEPVDDLGVGGGLAGEVKEVGDGLERVVDLVGHAGGETSDGGDLLTLDEGFEGALVLDELLARLEERHDLTRESFEGGDLGGGDAAGFVVEDADGAEDMAVGRDDGNSGVETDAGMTEDEGVLAEALVEVSVFDDEGLRLEDGVGAEACVAGGMADAEADLGLEPLPVLVDEADEREACGADEGGEGGDVGVALLGEGIEDSVGV